MEISRHKRIKIEKTKPETFKVIRNYDTHAMDRAHEKQE